MSNKRFFVKIENWKLQIGKSLHSGDGFTLVEILTSISLLAIISVIGVSMITFTLRGSKKTETTEIMRQNGDVILSTMVRNVRFATRIDAPACPSSDPSSELTILPVTGDQLTYSCSAIPNTITANGVPLINPDTIAVQDCSFTCREPDGAETPTIMIQFVLSTPGTSGFFENKVSIPFQSSVSVRNAK